MRHLPTVPYMRNKDLKVVEKFISINGEGRRAGELAVFIRFKGCNLGCAYCDTSWANDSECEFEEMSPEDIKEYIADTGIKNVTLTGGEPLLQNDIPDLLGELKKIPARVEIETNGSVSLKDYCGESRPVFTMDYKLPGSGCEERMLVENFSLLSENDTVKMVCSDVGDLERAKEIICEHKLTEKCYVYLSTVFGKLKAQDMVEYMLKHKLNDVRLQLQLHKYIWHPEAKGV